MGKFFTLEFAVFDDHQLATTGPYSIVRHPSYSGAVVMYAGLVLWHAFPGSYLMESGILDAVLGKVVVSTLVLQSTTIIVALFLRSRDEDDAMHKKFGKTWEEWAKKLLYSIPHDLNLSIFCKPFRDSPRLKPYEDLRTTSKRALEETLYNYS
ncbi:hypothetical protein E4T56_gene17956 [Termitomyces sp. T112]|nr:hypothetical protein E4T56_gene17956 [Termitomyces sp. T112]